MKNMALLLALALPVLLPGQAAHPQSVVSATDIFTGFSNRCNIGIGIMESLKRGKAGNRCAVISSIIRRQG